MTRRWMRFVFAASLAAMAHGEATQRDLEELVENRQWPQASAMAAQRLQATTADARLYWLAGRVRFAYGDLDKAAELTEKAAELDPKNADIQFRLFEIYGSQAQQASILRQPGLARKCKKAVDTALALDPKHIEALAGSMLYLYRAPSLFGGDRPRALAIPGEIGKFAPARGYMAQSRLDLLEKRYEQARECYRKAVAADPNLYNARLALSQSLAYNKEPDLTQAELHAREAVRINPKRADGWGALAYVLARQGKLADLDRVVAQAGESSVAPFQAGRGLHDGGQDAAKAEQLFRQYLKQPAQGPEAPPLAVVRMSLALALEKQSRKSEAIAELEVAAKLDPKHPAVQRELKRLRG